MENNLINNLLNSSAFKHTTQQIKLLETHISWIILTGEFAYKIKKPVDFGFLNYSTLEKRKFFCEEEVRLNGFLAPDLYLEVVPITGQINQPMMNGSGPAIEYAIKMRQFSQDQLFSALQKEKKLTAELIDSLAKQIAEFHLKTPVAAKDSIFGTPEHVHAPVVQNFEQILPLLQDTKDKQLLDKLQTWSEQQYKKYYPIFQQRKANGFIRDCHGDLHSGNIILFNGKPMLFDRIEFNDDLRWNDIIADIAFLAMDLEERQEFSLAKRLLNEYFSMTGDYQGLMVLPYYQAYRAIVRAKITLFHAQQTNLSSNEKESLLQQYRKFMDLAETYTNPAKPILLITQGVTGSGKSTIGREIAAKIGAFQVRSDIIRKRLLGLQQTARTNSGINQDAYDPSVTQKTYEQLQAIAEQVITAGYSVIIDAAFLKSAQREKFNNLAQQLKVPFAILAFQANQEQLHTWIKQRQAQALDPSEAGLEVLNMQQQTAEPLTDSEKSYALEINSASIVKAEAGSNKPKIDQAAIAELTKKIQQRLTL